MPNTRYITPEGEPQVELLMKLSVAKKIYLSNLKEFCDHECFPWDAENMKNISDIFLIGSHANEQGWKNDTSDLDLKLVVPDAIPQHLHKYKQNILDPILCNQDKEKQYWIDLFFARTANHVTEPKYSLMKYWDEIDINNPNIRYR